MKKISVIAFLSVFLFSSCASDAAGSSFLVQSGSSLQEESKQQVVTENHEIIAQERPAIAVEKYTTIECGNFLIPTGYRHGALRFVENDVLYYSTIPKNNFEEYEGVPAKPPWEYYRIDLSSQENVSVGNFLFSIGGDYKAFVNNRYIFLAPLITTSTGSMILQFLALDADSPIKEAKIVYEHEAAYVNNSVQQLNEEEVLLYFDAVKYDDNGKKYLAQVIVKYNFVKDISTEIFEHKTSEQEDKTNFFKTPWWMETYNGKIYLMLQEQQNGVLHTYVQILDGDGKLLQEDRIDALQDYGTLNSNSFFVVEGYYFFFYYYSDEKPEEGVVIENQKDKYAIVKKTERGFERVRYAGQMPGWPTRTELIRDRYIVFITTPNNQDYVKREYTHRLFVFDTVECSYWYVSLPEELIGDSSIFLSNSNGDLFIDLEHTYPGQGIVRFAGDDILGLAAA